MDSYKRGRPWGKLVKVDSSETVLLFNRECTVGRKKGGYVSACHGILFLDMLLKTFLSCFKKL